MNIYFKPEFLRNFGTWPLQGDDLHGAVQAAIKTGYRAFDTAQMYANEAELGDALAASGLPRNEVCVTTKVKIDNFEGTKFLSSVEGSLKALRLDFADVLLLHWPPPDSKDMVPTLKLLEEARNRGFAKNIGVSNFTSQMMRAAISAIDTPLVVNQVEFHPLLDQGILLGAAFDTGIPLSAYCSLARGEVLRLPELAEIGRNYGRSAGQIALRWILQKGVVPITMSTNPVNIRSNFDVADFSLSSIDMCRIDELSKRNQRIHTKSRVSHAPDWD